jgi:hypothetical protein
MKKKEGLKKQMLTAREEEEEDVRKKEKGVSEYLKEVCSFLPRDGDSLTS